MLLQKRRCKKAAKRCLQLLLDEQDIPEQIITDVLRSYGAAIRETPELGGTLHITVSASERQNNLIEQRSSAHSGWRAATTRLQKSSAHASLLIHAC